MRTLFVMDPPPTLHLEGDSTYALMVEATRRGWPVAWCTPDELAYGPEGPVAVVHPTSVHLEAPAFRDGPPRREPLAAFDAIWMRKDPPFDMEYVFATWLLDLVVDDVAVFNDPRTIKLANEKLFALRFPELCPPTRITRRVEDVLAAAEEHDRIVIKPWDGNGGRGVLVTGRGDRNLRSMVELLTDGGRRACIVQAWIPAIQEGDKRIILVDGEPMGWFLRVPGPDDHRGNMHVGASVVPCDLTDADRAICERIGPTLRAQGLLFVGIDVIGGFLTEINVTSPTGIREVLRLQGIDLAAALLDAAGRRRTGARS